MDKIKNRGWSVTLAVEEDGFIQSRHQTGESPVGPQAFFIRDIAVYYRKFDKSTILLS